MQDSLYYQLVLERVEAAGYSPHQATVLKRIVAAGEHDAEGADLARRMAEQGLDFALTRAAAADTWHARACAARENGNNELADILQQVATTALSAPDADTLNRSIATAATAATQAMQRYESIRHEVTAAMYALLELQAIHPADQREYCRAKGDFMEARRKLAGLDADFDHALGLPWIRSGFPFTEARWQDIHRRAAALAASAYDGQFGSPDNGEELRAALAELKQHAGQAAALQKRLDSQTRRSLYLAEAPVSEAGPYSFEKLWEGGL